MKFKHSVHLYKERKGLFLIHDIKKLFCFTGTYLWFQYYKQKKFFITYHFDIHNGKISIKNEFIPQIVEILVCCVKNTAFIYCTSELLFMIFRAFFH